MIRRLTLVGTLAAVLTLSLTQLGTALGVGGFLLSTGTAPPSAR